MTAPTNPSSESEHEARSVLVAFEDGTLRQEAMEAAVSMAAILGVELEGLYFENDILLRAAKLPFVQEVTSGSATLRPINANSIQRSMHYSAELAKQILEQWAQNANISCSFTVTRDQTIRRTLLTGTGAQVVCFACRSHPLGVRPPMGMHVAKGNRSLLVVTSQTPATDRALQATMALAANRPRPIVLIIAAGDPESFRRLGHAATELLCEQKLAHTLLPNPVLTAQALARLARDQRPGLLVVARDCEILNEQALELLVEEVDCPIVLV